MKKLSMILSFYDRDEDKIDSFTESVENLIKENPDIGYELEYIIVDDRKNKQKSLDKSSKYIVEPYKGNKGLLYSRWYGFEHSTGDYIWFVDADDVVVDLPKFDMTDLLYVFNYRIEEHVIYRDADRHFEFTDFMSVSGVLNWIRTGLWNKVFRRDVVESVYKDYDIENHKKKYYDYFLFEDFVFNVTSLKYINGFSFISQCVYKWYPTPLSSPIAIDDIIRAIETVPVGFRRNAIARTMLHSYSYVIKENDVSKYFI